MRILPTLLLSLMLTACGSSDVETHASHESQTRSQSDQAAHSELGLALEQIRALDQVKDLGLSDKLPSDQQIEKIISELPDFNHIMDGMVGIAQDKELQSKLKDSAEHMKNTLEKSGALETRENGLPDINGGIEAMLRALSDEDGFGAIVDTLEDVAKEMGEVVEEGLEKTPDPIHDHNGDDTETGLTKI